jgi:glycosyltransferase involved in cell wall biosynthesis
MMDRSATLVVLPALKAGITPSGGVVLSQRFVDGMQKYVEHWDGPVMVLMESTDALGLNFDDAEIDPAKLPFGLKVLSFTDSQLGWHLAGNRLVLASVSYRQNRIAAMCRAAAVPCVYVAEYSMRTRFQVVRADVRNPLVSLRRHWWELNQERLHRRAIRVASGIQCNGTPTYEAYRSINPSPFLFFDTRSQEDMLITDAELATRTDALKRGDPLRLLFSGRLIPMKGADHLVRVAAELRRLSVPFKMTICGDGMSAPRIKEDVARLHLKDAVELAGVLDFKTQLVPLTKHSTDLFVCCHRTGDPSCTYLDVMGCAVPTVGYDNEAFQGIVRESNVGWLAPLNRPEQVAAKIAELSNNRNAIVDASRRAVEFARHRTFERTFQARIAHMKSCAATIEALPVAI